MPESVASNSFTLCTRKFIVALNKAMSFALKLSLSKFN